MKEIVLTGDRPTGRLHLGHYEGSLRTRLNLQNTHELFIIIADTQVLNNDISKYKTIRENIVDVMKDYLAVGLNPNNLNFFLQSEIKELFELSSFLANFATLSQITRNPTIKAENEVYNKSMSMGFLNYPISQAADMLLFNTDIVPIGADQLPIIEFANDLVEKVNFNFNKTLFKRVNPVLSENSRLIGIDGKNKMSKSLGNSIFLSDTEEVVNRQIQKMYTDPNHIKITDPGQIEGNVVFQFLDIYHQNQDELLGFKEHYQKGGLGDGVLKDILKKDVNMFLSPIRENRDNISNEYALDILSTGTKKMQEIAKTNMDLFKEKLY